MEKPQLPSGTRDFSPQMMLRRKYILNIMESVFSLHGFGAIETPSIENLKTLQGKYGDEGDQLLFKVLNSGDFLSKANEQFLADKNSKSLIPQIADRGLRYVQLDCGISEIIMLQNVLQIPKRAKTSM